MRESASKTRKTARTRDEARAVLVRGASVHAELPGGEFHRARENMAEGLCDELESLREAYRRPRWRRR